MRLSMVILFISSIWLSGCAETGGGGLTVNNDADANTDAPNSDSSDDTPRAEPTCQTDAQFMANQVWPRILSQCAACHNSGGLAGNTSYILVNDANSHDSNWTTSQSYEQANSGQLLAKAMATVAHGGGRIIRDGDDNHTIFTEFLDRFDNPVEECTEDDSTPLPEGSVLDARALDELLTLSTPAETLRQAALLLAGRLPTEEELSAVNESNLKAAIRTLMTGNNFDQFLMEAANDQLHTMKWASSRTPGLSALNGEWYYPMVNSRIGALEDQLEALQNAGAADATIQAAQQAVWDAHRYTNRALAEEPLRLITYVANQERPYSEVITADYIMVNPYINDAFAAGASFTDNQDPNEWKPAAISSGYRNRTENLPHAGILTSPMYLARYPSTDTNRNRARARWTYYFFLGVDIEGLAVRPMNGDSLMDVENPTLNNPDCAVCHEIMDPVAGAFQNWGDDGQFRDQCGWYTDTMAEECDRDALPWVGYKEFGAPYVAGDLWYRDMRSPGFNTSLLPSNENDTSLRWLGQQMASDARFAEGTVRFWFKGILGREPTPLPGNSGDIYFNSDMAAHELDKLYINQLATAFASGTAGTGENGAYNLKDLIVEMIASPLFRANGSNTSLSIDEQYALGHTGTGRLLTPEQLNRKIHALIGDHWQHVWNADRNQLIEDFYGFYGGIDSDGVTDRNTEINALMATVIERMSNEMACNIVIDEFETPAAQRLLFRSASSADTPESDAGASAIRTTLTELIERLWGPDSATTEEIDAAYELFVALRNERIDNNATTVLATNNDSATNDENDEFCSLDWGEPGAIVEDSNQVLRPWMGVMVYLLSDYKMLYL